jgi:2-polyprenyl-6-methoxyphenol hydroxylase-like FAD-dependent oxidoreductase
VGSDVRRIGDHVPGITLLGDAAHLMPPYGIGANLAMLDGTDLATAIATHADLDHAVRSYENLMLPRATAAARACADLTDIINADTVVNVGAARLYLNEQISNLAARCEECPLWPDGAFARPAASG